MATLPITLVISRVIAVVIGGYAATIGLVSLASVSIILVSGMARAEAVVLMSIIGFLAYTAIVIWGFAEQRLKRVWTILGVGTVGSHIAATALAGLLPPIAGAG